MRTRQFRGLSTAGFHRNVYYEWGAEGAAAERTVICVHGLSRNGHDFDALAEALSVGLPVRVVCPDVVGRGRSEWLAKPELYGLPQYLQDMTALMARLDVESVDWVGTSMGGMIGMMLAAQPGSPIRRLVLNDVGAFTPKAAMERIRTYLGAAKPPVFEDVAAVEAYLRFIYMSFGTIPDERWRAMAEASARPLPDGRYGLAYDPGITLPFREQPAADIDLWPVWAAITCPVLVVRGATSDLLLAETAAEMAARHPDCRILVVPATGHAPSLMTADQIAPILDFLA